MSIESFSYYLHDTYTSDERADYIAAQLAYRDIELSDEVKEKIGRPFYEIMLNCTLDTETGSVKIVSAG